MFSFSDYADNVIKPIVATPQKDLDRLFSILRTQRPAHSVAEDNFVKDYLAHLSSAWQDEYGNVIVPVQMDKSKTMFSCHTDTVHPRPNTNYENKLVVDNVKQHVFTDGKQQLGADDGVGVWFMLNMIERGIPGLYIFHRAEEVGGVGSDHFVKHHAQYILDLEIQRCIAFDRHYYNDVITHQGHRCASDEFAQALSNELNQTSGFAFAPCDTGVFTDSANYIDIIPECTNLSVGYWKQHTINEALDYAFATKLLERLLLINWEALPTVRDVNDFDYAGGWFDNDYDEYYVNDKQGTTHYALEEMDMYDMVIEHPEYIADFLSRNGFNEDMLLDDFRQQPYHNELVASS